MLIGGTRDDDLDGGSGRDLVIGDNAVLDRTNRYGVYTSPRFRTLLTPTGAIYSTALATAGTAQVDGAPRLDPRGNAVWADYLLTLVDHAVGTDPLRYGGDYLAGGSEDDLIFGQLGNDTIQGDGNIDNGAYANRGRQRPADRHRRHRHDAGQRRRRLHRGRRRLRPRLR